MRSSATKRHLASNNMPSYFHIQVAVFFPRQYSFSFHSLVVDERAAGRGTSAEEKYFLARRENSSITSFIIHIRMRSKSSDFGCMDTPAQTT